MKNNKNKGFTFIELILYMAILGIFMVAVTSIVGATVASHKKQRSRQKLQNQATETYDTISNMVMAANDVMIHGTGYVGSGTSYTSTTGTFIMPAPTNVKDTDGSLKNASGSRPITRKLGAGNSPCYDIGDIKPIGDVAAASLDDETFIDADYLWVSYGSGQDTISRCTIKYVKSDKKLYLIREATDLTGTDYNSYTTCLESLRTTPYMNMKDGSNEKLIEAARIEVWSGNIANYSRFLTDTSADGILLAKNVTDFKLQLNQDDNSIAVTIAYEDPDTGEKYKSTGVVGIRNSFVLKRHEWN